MRITISLLMLPGMSLAIGRVLFVMNYTAKVRAPGAASFLGLSISTLAKMRLRGDGPPFAKLGKRVVLYDLKDLEDWVENRKRQSTSEVHLKAPARG